MQVQDLCDACIKADTCWVNLQVQAVAQAVKDRCPPGTKVVHVRFGVVECLKFLKGEIVEHTVTCQHCCEAFQSSFPPPDSFLDGVRLRCPHCDKDCDFPKAEWPTVKGDDNDS